MKKSIAPRLGVGDIYWIPACAGMTRKGTVGQTFLSDNDKIDNSRTGILACHLIVRQEYLTYHYLPKGKELYVIGVTLAEQVSIQRRCTTNSSLSPPHACEAQFCGDSWDHVAFEPEHKLAVSVAHGKRTKANVRRLVAEFRQRTGSRLMKLISSDKYKPYREAILREYGIKKDVPRRFHRGRKPLPKFEPPEGLLYAAVHKRRKKGRGVRISANVIYGAEERLKDALVKSATSRNLHVAFVERYNGTERHQNARKARKSYCFSKDWDITMRSHIL